MKADSEDVVDSTKRPERHKMIRFHNCYDCKSAFR